jgi:hypothetical protein
MFFSSLENTSVSYEVVFAGNRLPPIEYPCKYIVTENIKPAQCYEIARRNSLGEVIIWGADDCEFKGDIVGKAYEYWKKVGDEKLVLSLQTREFYLGGGDGFCDMTKHAFHGGDPKTPLMAPLAMMSRSYLEKLGGFDRRYICGQYENQTVCQVYADQGTVKIFGDRESFVEIDHINKSKFCGESKDTKDFFNRPFAKGYEHDRKILESACQVKGKSVEILSFEPYEDKDLLTKSQSHKGDWE